MNTAPRSDLTQLNRELAGLLRSPVSGKPLQLVDAETSGGRIRSGLLVSSDSAQYPIRDFIPRFVPEDNYAASFGMQWNHFAKTQLDSASGHPISAQRFWHATEWTAAQLDGRLVLDIGCGSGRFAEIALRAGAHVVALDYSSAVDACYANLRQYTNLDVVQADVYALPFSPGQFDFVYSLGVLQHTPDVAQAFAEVLKATRPGGHFCGDFYQKSWKSRLLPKYWLRPISTRIPNELLFGIVKKIVPALWPISRVVGHLPKGHLFKRVIPVADPVYFYEREYGAINLDREQRIEWALLDTFDWLSPTYDQPQTTEALRSWLSAAGVRDAEVIKAGHLVARGVAP